MFNIIHDLPLAEEKYAAPTLLLNSVWNYSPFLSLKKNINYLQQIDFATQDLINILQIILREIENTDAAIQVDIEKQLLFLRENYPLSYTSYAKSCSTISSLIFSTNSLEFADAQVSQIYNELLDGTRITLLAQGYVADTSPFLNEQVILANKKINFINKYAETYISPLVVVTDYRAQNYKTIVVNKITEVELFIQTYRANNYI